MLLLRGPLLFFIILKCFLNATCGEVCNPDVYSCFPFIIEYAVWRNWNQVLIFTPDLQTGCISASVRLVKCLGINGIAVALNVKKPPHFSTRVGVIILPVNSRNSTTFTRQMKQLNDWELNTASTDWIVATKSLTEFKQVNSALNSTELRYDQNIVVAYPNNQERKLNFCEGIFEQRSNFNNYETKLKKDFQLKKPRNSIRDSDTNYRAPNSYLKAARNKKINRDGHLIPLLRAGNIAINYSREFKMINVSDLLKYNVSIKTGIGIHLVQYFKARVNSTLYASYLGKWSMNRSMAEMQIPYPVESRNFMGEKLIVGRCNYTHDEKPASEDEGPSSPQLDDLLYFINVKMNGTAVTRFYSKLGFRTYEGAWSGLLGALLDRSVDIALEPVTEQALSQREMDFIFPIAETMYNIYIRNQETSSVRDIFLAPFSTRLLICVAVVVLVAAVCIVVITNLSRALQKGLNPTMSCTEGLVWATGILCQQGGSWTPTNPAASILLIVCLFFGLITYNAYAAFITSVLSVRVANVGTVADVLDSPNMKIGYIKNGADQIYLMSTKDVQLNAFYIRGYSEAENLVSSAEEGLSRAASEDYAFFAGQRAARSTLKSLSQARGRCALRELPVHSTRSQLSFPLPRGSPYSRPILLSLLQLRSGGSLSRLAASLVPAMPQCAAPSGFASARAADVQTAFLVIVTGLIASLFVGLVEYFWKYRSEKWRALKKHFYRCKNIFG